MAYIDTDILNADFIQQHTSNADVFLTVRKILDSVPAADVVAAKHAEWINIRHFLRFNVCYGNCSVCGAEHQATSMVALKLGYRYCRNCGAQMIGEGKTT